MNAAEVLSTLSVESGKYDFGQKQSEGSGIDGTLFAMLLGSMLSGQGNLEEQYEDTQGYALAGGILANSAYSPYLQIISPAGMEADSGQISQVSVSDYLNALIGELSLESSQIQGKNENQSTQIIGDSDLLAKLVDAVKTGSVTAGSLEGISLDSSELEKYIGILNQVDELSGKLELKVNKTDSQTGLSAFQAEAMKTIRELHQNGESSAKNEDNSGDWGSDTDDMVFTKVLNDPTSKINSAQTDNPVFNQNDAVLSALSNPSKIWAQVLDAIHNQKGVRDREINEISLQLQPEELGKLHVSMKMENGQLHMIINASEQATGVFIQNHMAELKESLNQAGIECSMMQMGLSSDSEKSQEWNYNQNNSKTYRSSEEQESAKTISMIGYGMSVGSNEHGSINISV